MSRFKLHSFVVSASLLLIPTVSLAQAHKGISFQGVIKLPSGEYPTKSGLTVRSYILSSNNCILREEQFTGVDISNGYINIPIGTGTVTGDDPGLTMKQVMDNSSPITRGPNKTSGLVCLDSNGNVDSSVTSFNPATGDGRRKFRLNVVIDGTPVIADFNMRSVAYAINAESAETSDDSKKFDGKLRSDFLQVSSDVNQSILDSWFSQLVSNGNIPPIATTISNTLPINKGGTNLTATGSANQLLGVTGAGGALEYKTLTAGSNVTITHGANNITINAAGGGGGGVTSVTASTPLSSSGGTTPTITIPKASTSVDGYLSSADWNTFNGKQNANSELTAIGNLAMSGILQRTGSGTYATLGLASPLSVVGNDIVMSQANTTTAGYLSAADWNVFNGKQAALGFTPLNPANNLSDLGNAATARANLGLSAVAASGSYADLFDKPTIPAAQVNADWNSASGLSQILNKPTLGTLAEKNTVATADISDGAVTDAKIAGVSASKLSGVIDSARLPAASDTADGIINQIAQSIKGVKTFLGNIVMQGTLTVAGAVSADRIKLANSSATCNASVEGSVRYNNSSKKLEYCNGAAWFGVTPEDPCLTGTPSPGTVCLSGTIYLGSLSWGSSSVSSGPVDRYMTTPGGCGEIPEGQKVTTANTPKSDYPNADFTPNCSGTDILAKSWNDGTTNYFNIGNLTNYTSTAGVGQGGVNTDDKYGQQNAVEIVAITDPASGGYHAAARYCDKLSYGGYTDWYLPNRYELNLMWTNAANIPGLDLTGNWYWSSTGYYSFVDAAIQ